MKLNEKSGEQVVQLDAASKKALDAMQKHDEALLQESISETEALRLEIERLKESVYKDSLTKTWNRKWLEANILDEEGRFKEPCTIAIIDLNYFKEINDTVGHIAGDKVLKYISANLQALDIPVVRYGGDEFLLISKEPKQMNEVETNLKACRNALLKKTSNITDTPSKHTSHTAFTSVEKMKLSPTLSKPPTKRCTKTKRRSKR